MIRGASSFHRGQTQSLAISTHNLVRCTALRCVFHVAMRQKQSRCTDLAQAAARLARTCATPAAVPAVRVGNRNTLAQQCAIIN